MGPTAQTIAIFVLFVLFIVGAYLLYEHKHDATAHKTVIPPVTTPAPIAGGTPGTTPHVEQK